MRDLHNTISAAVAKAPAAIASNTTTNGSTVDLQGYESCEFVIVSGTLTDGSYAINVQESDDNATWSDAPASAILGAEPTFAATDDNTVKSVGYVGSKRYTRIQIVSTGVTTGGTIGASAIRGRVRHSGGKAV